MLDVFAAETRRRRPAQLEGQARPEPRSACASECSVEATSHDDDAVVVAAADGLRAVAARVLSTNTHPRCPPTDRREASPRRRAARDGAENGHQERGPNGAASPSPRRWAPPSRPCPSTIFRKSLKPRRNLSATAGGYQRWKRSTRRSSSTTIPARRDRGAAGVGPRWRRVSRKFRKSGEGGAALAHSHTRESDGSGDRRRESGQAPSLPLAGPTSAEHAELSSWRASLSGTSPSTDARSPLDACPVSHAWRSRSSRPASRSTATGRWTWRSALRVLADVAAGDTRRMATTPLQSHETVSNPWALGAGAGARGRAIFSADAFPTRLRRPVTRRVASPPTWRFVP